MWTCRWRKSICVGLWCVLVGLCVRGVEAPLPWLSGRDMAAFADFDLTDRQRVDKRILHWTGTTRLFQIGMTIEKPCV